MKRGVAAVASLIAIAAASLVIVRMRRTTISPKNSPVPIAHLAEYHKKGGVQLDSPAGMASWGDIGPLEFARRLSETGKFDCVAFAPRPLDLAHFEYQEPVGSLSKLLDIGRQKFGQLEWERHDGWILLYFGPKEELESLKRKHDSLPPVLVSSVKSVGMLRMLADIWNQKIDVEPAIVQSRDALLKEHRRASGRDRIPWGSMQYGGYNGGYMEGESEGGARLTFTIVQTTSLREVIERAAVTLGGECIQQNERWIIRKHVDGRQLNDQVERLMSDLHARGSAESSDATLGLVAIGRPAIPALLKALDPQQPELAATAAGALADLKASETVPRIIDVWRKIKKSKKTPAEAWQQAAQLASFAESLGKLGDSQAINALVKAATDPDEAAAVRAKARQSLVLLGAVDALSPETRGTIEPPSRRFQFTLRRRSKGNQYETMLTLPPNTFLIDAQCQDDQKNHWALFRCSKLGNPQDLWVAMSSDGVTWKQFEFTGVQDKFANMYGGGEEDPRSKREIVVKGNTIAIKIPNPETIYRAMRGHGKLAPGVSPTVKHNSHEINLADLRKDTDHDGLTDIIERRLGTHSHQADTDKDGIPDGRDGNPLAPRSTASSSDRNDILQLLFTYKYAGEPMDDVLVIHSAKRLRNEFHGYPGPVISIGNDSPQEVIRDFTSARVLHLGGPQSSENTVLTTDGPVCFNESHTRAQVTFWVTDSREMYGYYDELSAGDQVALFEKKDNTWKLVKVVPWDWMSMMR